MKAEYHPVWPWKQLGTVVAHSDSSTLLAFGTAAALALAAPFVLARRPRPGWREHALAWLPPAGLYLWAALRVAAAARAADVTATLLTLPLPVVLVALTLWAYLGTANVTPRRLSGLVALRLLALALALLAILRPAFAR